MSITYREPTYELRAGSEARPYRWTCEVRASSPAEAEAAARRELARAAALSGVGWVREVLSVDILEVEP